MGSRVRLRWVNTPLSRPAGEGNDTRACRDAWSLPVSEGDVMVIHQATRSESRGESVRDLAATAMPGIAITGRRPWLAASGTCRRLRSWVAKAAAIAVPAALTVAASGAAHAAAARQASPAAAHRGQAPALGIGARPAATTFSWHKLALLNGWKSSQTSYHSGSPSYAISNGIVYLAGALHLSAGASKQFAVLPRAARPAHRMFVKVYTANGTYGILQLNRNGAVLASSSPAGNARTFLSLAAVSFPAAAFRWHKLTLLNGWKSTAGSLQTGDPSYAVKAGVVYLSGGLRGGTTNFFAALPAAARPARMMYRSVDTANGTWGAVVIETDGNMFAYGNPQQDAQKFTSLAAVSFAARTVSPHEIALIN